MIRSGGIISRKRVFITMYRAARIVSNIDFVGIVIDDHHFLPWLFDGSV